LQNLLPLRFAKAVYSQSIDIDLRKTMKTSLSPHVRAAHILIVGMLAACAAPQTAEPTTLPAPTDTPQPVPTQVVEPTTVPTPIATPAIATAETGQTLTLVWQSEFGGDAALGGPVDIAVDDDGNSYVTAQGSKNIKKFDSDGNFAGQWGGFGGGEGQFNLATGIDVDAQGNVYIDDFENMRVQKFDTSGTFLWQWPIEPANSPGSIAVDDRGNVYVSMFRSNDDNLQKYDTDGTLMTAWGGTGSEAGQFSGRIEDIALDWEGNVYVSDPFNYRIQKFDPAGNFLMQIGGESSEAGNGGFYNPKGITVDPHGNIFVVDDFFLQKFDAEGNFLAQWSTTDGGLLDRAGFLAVDAEGALYILARTDITSPTGDTFNVIVVKKFQQ
jgi:streptogramin lyase